MVTVTLNHYDNNGVVVDDTEMDLSEDAVSDIIDQAANVILAMRHPNQIDFQAFLDELEEALVSYDVIADE